MSIWEVVYLSKISDEMVVGKSEGQMPTEETASYVARRVIRGTY